MNTVLNILSYTHYRQCLTMPPSGQKVIFCTHFCVLLPPPPPPPSGPRPHTSPTAHSTPHHLPTPPSLTSSHTRGRSVGGLCQIRSPHKSPTPHISSLTKSPSQVWYIVHVQDIKHYLKNASNTDTNGIYSRWLNFSYFQQADRMKDRPTNYLDYSWSVQCK